MGDATAGFVVHLLNVSYVPRAVSWRRFGKTKVGIPAERLRASPWPSKDMGRAVSSLLPDVATIVQRLGWAGLGLKAPVTCAFGHLKEKPLEARPQ